MSPRVPARLHSHIATLLLVLTSVSTVSSQDSKISTKFIPADAVAVVDARIEGVWQSDFARLFPKEVVHLWCEQNIGIQIDDLRGLRVVGSMPTGPGDIPVGAVISFNKPTKPEQLIGDWLAPEDESSGGVTIGGRPTYRLKVSGGPPLHLAAISDQIWMVGGVSYLERMLQTLSEPESGKLSDIAKSVEKRGDIQAILNMEVLGPFMQFGIMSQVEQMPPGTERIPQLFTLFDAAWTSMELFSFDMFTYGSWTLRAKDEASADLVEEITEEAIESVKRQALAMAQAEFADQGPMGEAWLSYFNRLGDEVPEFFKPVREGLLFKPTSLDGEDLQVIGATGVLVGLLLPAVQSAREAARRMTDANNLKQIGLAMHNHYSTFNHLPKPAITDDSGKPLLSWRVKILPFIEQQALYEQFHLDEPWDSPHNLTLIEQMPETFKTPSMPLPPGQTNYRLAFGPGCLFSQIDEEVKFREVRDGLSNTIMALETDASDATIWTKPDIDFGLYQNPPQHFNQLRNGSNVLMSDGSVRFLPTTINGKDVQAAMTRAGGEIVNLGL